MSGLRIASWNVNGLRAAVKKGLPRWVAKTRPDIVALQEIRAHPEQVQTELSKLRGFHHVLTPAERKGYSGVGLFSRLPPDEVRTSLSGPGFDATHFDVEGRVHLARFGALWVVNVYVPNGNGQERDNSRIPYKLAFWRRLFKVLEPMKERGDRILVMGDLNTAHQDIDLARPKENVKTSGFTPPERAELDRWMRAGWVDTFRHFEKGPGHYSWWSQRFGVREKNIGWRLDMVLASPGAMPFVESAFIEAHVKGSDHAPVGVVVRERILEGR